MKYLFDNYDSIQAKLKNSKLAIFIDYDGVIVPIAATPQKAVLPQETKTLLKKISKITNLSIISGRSLKDIKKMIGIKNITYIGNHGLEIQGARLKFTRIINRIKIELKKNYSSIKGVLIEDKGITISIHYRLANNRNIRVIRDIFYKITSPWTNKKKIRITSGKKVLEVRPYLNWNKGSAVKWISKNKPGYPIYLGDDTTDEDAFKVLRVNGITIFVGKPKKSYAKFYLKNTKEVIKLLRRILNERNSR